MSSGSDSNDSERDADLGEKEMQSPLTSAVLIHCAQELESDPVTAASRLRAAEAEGAGADWSVEELLFAADVYLEGADQLMGGSDPSETDRLGEAATWCQAAAEAYVKAEHSADAAEAMAGVGDLYLSLNDLSAAEPAFDRARSLAAEGEDLHFQARCLTSLGRVRFQLDDLSGATGAYEEALKLFEQTGDQRRRALTQNNLGEIKAEAGLIDEALEQYLAALPILEELEDKPGLVRTHRSLGALKARQGRFKEAIESLGQAIPLFLDIWDRIGEADTFRDMGQLFSAMGHHEAAIASLKDAFLGHSVESDLQGMAEDLEVLGKVALASRARRRAALYLESALSIYRRLDDQRSELRVLVEQADIISLLSDQRITALSCLDRAANLAEATNAPEAEGIKKRGETLRQELAKDSSMTERGEAQGVLTMLDEPALAVAYLEDQLVIAETAEDLESFLSALEGQITAMVLRGQHLGALAALLVGEEALQQDTDEGEGGRATRLFEKGREMLRALGDSQLEELRGKVGSDPETVRAAAVAKVTVDIG